MSDKTKAPNFISQLKTLLDLLKVEWRNDDKIHGMYQDLVKSLPSPPSLPARGAKEIGTDYLKDKEFEQNLTHKNLWHNINPISELHLRYSISQKTLAIIGDEITEDKTAMIRFKNIKYEHQFQNLLDVLIGKHIKYFTQAPQVSEEEKSKADALTGLIITQLTDNRKSGKGGIFLADGFYEVVENYFKSHPSSPTQKTNSVREEVLGFAEIMEQKLKENDHKKHWSNFAPEDFIIRLRQELKELDDTLGKTPSEDADWQIKQDMEIQRECADIANFAMMIADNVKKLSFSPSAPTIGERVIGLKQALIAVDQWLNSDDTWVTDMKGNKIKGLVACTPGTMTNKFVENMAEGQHKGKESREADHETRLDAKPPNSDEMIERGVKHELRNFGQKDE